MTIRLRTMSAAIATWLARKRCQARVYRPGVLCSERRSSTPSYASAAAYVERVGAPRNGGAFAGGSVVDASCDWLSCSLDAMSIISGAIPQPDARIENRVEHVRDEIADHR